MCLSSRFFIWHSVASAWLIHHVMLLIGQALLDASGAHTVQPTHADLANSVWYAAGPQPDLGNLTWGLPACIQAMSVVIALIHDSQ